MSELDYDLVVYQIDERNRLNLESSMQDAVGYNPEEEAGLR